MTIEQIEQAIKQLSPAEITQLCNWLDEFEVYTRVRQSKQVALTEQAEKVTGKVVAVDYDDVL